MRFAVTALVIITLLGAGSASAQVPAAGIVSGTGVVEIKRAPTVLRVQVEVMTKGKDLKEALAKLKQRRESLEKELAALGATKESIAFGEPNVTAEKNDQQRAMEMMVRQRLGARGKKPDPKSKTTPPVAVAMLLKVEFTLKATNAEEALLSGHALQEKIKAADLGSVKETEKLTPEEEEQAEEMQANMGYDPYSGQPKRGEPIFMYIAKIADADREKALADAFQKAKAEAARLAKAAGSELGSLQQISSHRLPSLRQRTPYNPYGNEVVVSAQNGDAGEDDEANGREAIGMTPDKVGVRISVTAAFALRSADGK